MRPHETPTPVLGASSPLTDRLHIVLSGASMTRKRHENVTSIVMNRKCLNIQKTPCALQGKVALCNQVSLCLLLKRRQRLTWSTNHTFVHLICHSAQVPAETAAPALRSREVRVVPRSDHYQQNDRRPQGRVHRRHQAQPHDWQHRAAWFP